MGRKKKTYEMLYDVAISKEDEWRALEKLPLSERLRPRKRSVPEISPQCAPSPQKARKSYKKAAEPKQAPPRRTKVNKDPKSDAVGHKPLKIIIKPVVDPKQAPVRRVKVTKDPKNMPKRAAVGMNSPQLTKQPVAEPNIADPTDSDMTVNNEPELEQPTKQPFNLVVEFKFPDATSSEILHQQPKEGTRHLSQDLLTLTLSTPLGTEVLKDSNLNRCNNCSCNPVPKDIPIAGTSSLSKEVSGPTDDPSPPELSNNIADVGPQIPLNISRTQPSNATERIIAEQQALKHGVPTVCNQTKFTPHDKGMHGAMDERFSLVSLPTPVARFFESLGTPNYQFPDIDNELPSMEELLQLSSTDHTQQTRTPLRSAATATLPATFVTIKTQKKGNRHRRNQRQRRAAAKRKLAEEKLAAGLAVVAEMFRK